MKIIIFTILLICVVISLNAQTTWLDNDSIVGYKTEYDNYMDIFGKPINVSNDSYKNVDGDLTTYTQYIHTNGSGGEGFFALYYYDLKKITTLNSFKINTFLSGIQSTLKCVNLYCSNNPNGPWVLALNYNFDIMNYVDHPTENISTWIIMNFIPKTARYWKLEGHPYKDRELSRNIFVSWGGFIINEIGFGQQDKYPLKNGLIAWYTFNGNANDESGFNNNGRINGSILTTDRFNKENSAYKFDGIDDYIRIPNANEICFGKNNWSISLWFNSATLKQSSSLISKNSSNCWSNGGKQVMWNDSTFISLDCYGATGSPINMKLDTNTWYHYVVTYDQILNLWKAYINGLIVSYVNFDMTNDTQDAIIKIGSGYKECEYTYFNGKIDDIYIYNRTLSDEDIDTLYYSQTEPIDTSTTDVKNITQTKIKIYPNPTSNIINLIGIDVKQIEIFNISGLKVLISNTNQVDVSGLVYGTYITKIIGKNNEISINKFIKN